MNSQEQYCISCSRCVRVLKENAPISSRGVLSKAWGRFDESICVSLILSLHENERNLFWSDMLFPAYYDPFTDLFLTKPKAFLLLSYFYIESRDENSLIISYRIEDLSYCGHRKVLTKAQAKVALQVLEKRGFIAIKRSSEPYLKKRLEITLLYEEFLYV